VIDPIVTFDLLWGLARRRLHAHIDLMARAALAEVKGKDYTRSLGQLRRQQEEHAK
jgi:hypothetical protein